MIFCVSIKQYEECIPIIEKTRIKATVIKKTGLPVLTEKYKSRKMFVFGLFVCCLIIYILNLFIWDIEISGNSSITKETILDYLKTQNIEYGSFKYKIDSVVLEKKLRNEFDDIIWASVEKKGTRILICIQESLLHDEKKEANTSPQSIYSTKNGIITRIVTRSGTPVVNVGSEVSAGSLLVDGRIEITGDDESVIDTKLCYADADIYIKTVYDYSDIFSLKHTKKKYSDNVRKKYYLKVMSKTIDFSIGNKKYDRQETLNEVSKLKLWKDFYLPVYIGKVTEKEYKLESENYDKKEALEVAKKHLRVFCENLQRKGVQIISKDVKMRMDNTSCYAGGKVTVIEKTGEHRDIVQEEK